MGRKPTINIPLEEAQRRTGLTTPQLQRILGVSSQKWAKRGISVAEHGKRIDELEEERRNAGGRDEPKQSGLKNGQRDLKPRHAGEMVGGGLFIREGGTVYLPGAVLSDTIKALQPPQIVAFLRGLRTDASLDFSRIAAEAQNVAEEVQRQEPIEKGGIAPPGEESSKTRSGNNG